MAILHLLSSALQKDIMMAADNKQGKEIGIITFFLQLGHKT